jgi:hypothetical protein
MCYIYSIQVEWWTRWEVSIYEAHKQGTQLNEALTEPYNPIYEIVIKNRLNNNPSMIHNQRDIGFSDFVHRPDFS